jgi:hypothetical protein
MMMAPGASGTYSAQPLSKPALASRREKIIFMFFSSKGVRPSFVT